MESIKRILTDYLRCDVEEVDALLNKYNTNIKLANATSEEISECFDGNMSTSVCIKLIFSLISRRVCDSFKLKSVHTEEEIKKYFSALFLPLSEETVYLMSLDEGGRVSSVDFVTEGTVNALGVIPRRLLDIALKRGAASVIIAHNHPSGYAIPSSEDVSSTEVIKDALHSAGIDLVAHYVVAGADVETVKL